MDIKTLALAKKIIAQEIAKITESDGGSISTLKEIIAWIEEHPDIVQGFYSELDELKEELNKIELTPGPEGPQGKNGKSAFELAQEEGFEGTLTEWLDSLVGPQGPMGEGCPPGVDTLIERVNYNSTQIDRLTQRADDNSSQISGWSERISSNTTRINAMTEIVDRNSTQIDGLGQSYDEHKAEFEDLNIYIQSIVADVEANYNLARATQVALNNVAEDYVAHKEEYVATKESLEGEIEVLKQTDDILTQHRVYPFNFDTFETGDEWDSTIYKGDIYYAIFNNGFEIDWGRFTSFTIEANILYRFHWYEGTSSSGYTQGAAPYPEIVDEYSKKMLMVDSVDLEGNSHTEYVKMPNEDAIIEGVLAKLPTWEGGSY